MIRATYADLQPNLARIAGVSGMAVTDARVMNYTNLATQELMDEEDWPQLVVRMRFKVSNHRINVPSEFDRILMLTVNGVPQPMQSPWFEFVGYGWGFLSGSYNVPPVYGDGAFDQGLLGLLEGVLDKEQVATFEDIPNDGNTYFPTIYATANERVNGVDPVITLQGYDQSRNWIRTNDPTAGWIDGVNVTINSQNPPFVSYCPQAFSVVTAILKPVTNGYINLYCDSKSPGQQNKFLCSYAPYDTRPYYRRYSIPNLTNNSGQIYCVDARLRKRYAPIVNSNDFLLISNLPALSTMVQAIYYRESNDLQNYAAYKQIAIDILKKEMTSYIGKQRQKPLITVNEGFGARLDGNYIL